ncbi:C39 family peptidase [Microbispora sp. NBC_01389]|uniref:C39 family peptidase n=1 Tax=Microbispora sp. NBC_01389 TaxID=2903584 RepID=UPI0032452ECA
MTRHGLNPRPSARGARQWGRWPSARDTSWVDPADPAPEVDYAARHTYDYAYEGAGNWPFNTAYAGRYGMEGFVTRLRSLTELERLIRAGVPVVTSQSFKAEELPGAGYSTNGHLMVIIGFTATGDVIANDPASRDDAAVRRVYPRANFENVWLRSTGSGGIVYVIHPPGHRLPATTPGLPANW